MLSQTEINWSEIYNELIDNLFNIYQTMKIENQRVSKLSKAEAVHMYVSHLSLLACTFSMTFSKRFPHADDLLFNSKM